MLPVGTLAALSTACWWYGRGECLDQNICNRCIVMLYLEGPYGDGTGNTAEENSSVFSLIRMR